MDWWLKALVATACVVVIAGGAYFAFNEHAKSNEIAARQACAARAGDLAAGISRDDDVTFIKRCMFSGYLPSS